MHSCTVVSIIVDPEFATGLLTLGVNALLSNDAFKLSSVSARQVLKTATDLFKWMQFHQKESVLFESNLIKNFQQCLPGDPSMVKVLKNKMWSKYHILRTSSKYTSDWRNFINPIHSDIATECMLIQFIGHYVFKEIVKRHFTVSLSQKTSTSDFSMSYEEKNALRYSAGYVTRSVKKEIAKSSHPLKDDIVWCIDDMTGCDEDLDIDSSDWIMLIDRGGLTCVNNITFELFQAMEIEFHEHLKLPLPENFRSIVASAIVNNKDVLFFWDIISTEWEEEVSRIMINKMGYHSWFFEC